MSEPRTRRSREEDADEQTDLMEVKEESEELREVEEDSEEISDVEEESDKEPSEEESDEDLCEDPKNPSRKRPGRTAAASALTCPQCGRSFTVKRSLTVHMRIHSGERPFTCGQCGRSFTQHSYLNIHIRAHSAERPYACAQCGKTYKYAALLNYHVLAHGGVKPYHCAPCRRSFGDPSTLRRHLRSFIHNKYKPLEKVTLQFESAGLDLEQAYDKGWFDPENRVAALLRLKKQSKAFVFVSNVFPHSRRL